MKRTDMTPGQDYLHTSSNDWQGPHAYGITRVRVLSTDTWGERTRLAGYGGAPRPTTDVTVDGQTYTTWHDPNPGKFGTRGPLVITVNAATGKPSGDPWVALPQQVRATWAEATATRRAHREAREAREAAEAQAKADRVAAHNALVDRLEAVLGPERTRTRRAETYWQTRDGIQQADALALLDLLDPQA